MPLSLHPLARLLCLLLLGTLLAACGGGGGSSPPSTGPGPTAAPLGTGTFVDAPTAGLFYYAYPSGLQGTTDTGGHFAYRLGDVVTFKLQLGSGTLTLGEFSPGSTADIVSVLALRRGGQVAQLLQALDHAADAGHQEVGGLILNWADFDALVAWLNSDGQILPAGKTAQQMLADAQAGAADSPVFRHPGALPLGTAMANAVNDLQPLFVLKPAAYPNAFPKRLLLHTGFSNYGPVAQLLWFDNSSAQSRVISMTRDSSGVADYPGAYASLGSALQLANGEQMNFRGSTESGMTSFTGAGLDMGMSVIGMGNYQVLENAALDLRNQTRTIRGYYRCDAYGGTTFVFSADGLQWSAYCETATALLGGSVPSPQPIESGSVSIDPALPQLATLTNSCGEQHYLGVLEGSFSKGTLVLLTPGTAPSTVGKLNVGGVRETATSHADLLLPFTGSCAGSGPATPAPAFYSGRSLAGTFTGPDNLSARVAIRMGTQYYGALAVATGTGTGALPLAFHHLPESGSYTVEASPGCTVQNGAGMVESGAAFSVDCSNYASVATYLTQGGHTWLLGRNDYVTAAVDLADAPFMLSLPPLPDSLPLRVCATRPSAYTLLDIPITSMSCFGLGTGMAMPYNPSPQTGMPLYVRQSATAHNYYSSDRRVTTATATTVYVNAVGFLDGLSAGPFHIAVLADRNNNGLVDADEAWSAAVGWPETVAP